MLLLEQCCSTSKLLQDTSDGPFVSIITSRQHLQIATRQSWHSLSFFIRNLLPHIARVVAGALAPRPGCRPWFSHEAKILRSHSGTSQSQPLVPPVTSTEEECETIARSCLGRLLMMSRDNNEVHYSR